PHRCTGPSTSWRSAKGPCVGRRPCRRCRRDGHPARPRPGPRACLWRTPGPTPPAVPRPPPRPDRHGRPHPGRARQPRHLVRGRPRPGPVV
ncbi:uncharacterized protein METZ01_LOCUS182066, partial [marine metagenome]